MGRTPAGESELDERGVRFDYTQPLDEALARYSRATDNVMDRLLNKDQIVPPELRALNKDRTYFEGHLPPGWANLPMRELGDLFELMTRHADFIGTKLTYAKAEKVNADERLKLVRAHVRRSKRGTVGDKEDDTLVDSRYVQANADWLEASEYHDLLSSIYEAAGRDIRILSRVLETKKLEGEHGGRVENLRRGPDVFRRS